MTDFKETALWRNSLGNSPTSSTEDAISTLKSNYMLFRERAAALTSRIREALPGLTIHDVTHLDALWETADLIAGDNYPINPAEAFVFGGALLLHDAALCFEAYEGGRTGLQKTVEWKDAFAELKSRELNLSDDEKMRSADFSAMRILHASRAAELAHASWDSPEDEKLFLIDNPGLRKHYGHIIGTIAASHNWPIEDLTAKLPNQINAMPNMPLEWRVDPIKVACLLRCADAAHLDSRRAPDFLRSLASLHGVSAAHWTAQNWLERVDLDSGDSGQNSIIFTSGRPFSEDNAEAWWVAYDAICLVDNELKSCSDLLQSRPQSNLSPPFRIRKVTGAGSPAIVSKSIATVGWVPQAVEIHASNLERLIKQLGGSALYGETQQIIVVLRELIQNSRDSIVARRSFDKDYSGRIKIVLNDERHSISIFDDGIGMSHRVITGPLLDFGSSFWASELVKREFPGLISSGYKPVGKFGIGFYSIFMIASSVTVSSRRFDGGLDSVTQVRFPHGLSLRPVISSGAPKDFGYSTSTVVEINLQPKHENLSKIIVAAGRQEYEKELTLSLHQCLSALCAGLDVVVELDNGDGQSSIVHQLPQELDSPAKRSDWLFKISGNISEKYERDVLSEHATRLRPIVDGERILGFAALSTVRLRGAHSVGSIRTVGGLASAIGRSDMANFFGFIDFHPNSAKREPSAKPSAGQAAFEDWALEQQDLLLNQGADGLELCFATCGLADFGCDPIKIATTLVRIGNDFFFYNIDQMVDILLSKGLAFYQSPMMLHVETHHNQGAFKDIPTFWPVANSDFLSLRLTGQNCNDKTSILSCLERCARDRGLIIEQQYAPEAVLGHFGLMPVLILSAKNESKF